MQKTAAIFASDTSRSDKREVMKEASRDLLMAVVRLMVIADAVDVSKLLNVSNRVRYLYSLSSYTACAWYNVLPCGDDRS